MKTVSLNTDEASNKRFAAMDARMRSLTNESLYTNKEKIVAERIKIGAEMVYNAKEVYISYGKTGISIKLDHPVVRLKKELKLLEGDWEKLGCVKRKSTQGLIYRLPKIKV
jgi:hypothetical protein